MTDSTTTAATRTQPGPRRRLLDAANRLFYAEGIHTVGVDRILRAADVAKASFYHHFPSKDDLVVAYLEEQSAGLRARLDGDLQRLAPTAARDRVGVIFAALRRWCGEAGYRGCPFINANAEYPHPDHPVRRLTRSHRAWMSDLFATQLQLGGHGQDPPLVGGLVMLHDGYMVRAQMGHADESDADVGQLLDRLLPPRRC